MTIRKKLSQIFDMLNWFFYDSTFILPFQIGDAGNIMLGIHVPVDRL